MSVAKPHIMGIVNVTPDSFSDGGRFLDHDKAIKHGLKMIADGADSIDIGAESTRPGAAPVDPQTEIQNIIPVLTALRGQGADLSVDTRNAATMAVALETGATIINDVSALTHDPRSLAIIAAAPKTTRLILMHMQGTPQTMQKNPSYTNVVKDVFDFLYERIKLCEDQGIDKNRLTADPGFGFGKNQQHNSTLLKHIDDFHDLGVPLMLGVSRKGFIGKLSGDMPVEKRMPGSIAAALYARTKGVQFFRVHDVAETRQALAVFDALS